MKNLTILTLLILASSCGTLNSRVATATGHDPILSWVGNYKLADAQAASATALAANPPDTYAAQCYDTIAEALIAFGELNGTAPAGALDAFERLRLLNRSITTGGMVEKLKVKCAWMIGPGGLH